MNRSREVATARRALILGGFLILFTLPGAAGRVASGRGAGEASPGPVAGPDGPDQVAGSADSTSRTAPLALLEGEERGEGVLVVTHGGVGSPPEVADGPEGAAREALSVLAGGGSGLDGAVAGVRVMEDDPRFNAGTGANIRLDGRTIQMDASVMTGEGRYAAVAVIERVRNPILVAREVLNTPHLLLAGEGATRFAHRLGFEDVVPVSEPARAKYERLKERLLSGETSGGYREFDWRKFWNFPGEIPEELREGDTVGAVARDGERGFAAALSTGGTSFTLYGRVGDVPVFGAGLYAGPVGAVACTGHGEIIIRQALARSTYERMVMGATPRQAVEASVRGFPETSSVGLIAVSNGGWAVAANRPMAYGMAGE